MKNIIIRSLVLAFVLAAGAAMAQTVRGSASHDVSVTIPEIAFIRISNGNAPITGTPTAVQFGFTAATFQTGVALSPTNAGTFNWDDVQVLINRDSNWEVVVSTTDTSTAATSFDWSKVAMTTTGTGVADYDLGTGGPTTLISASTKTTGWFDLGIDPDAYTVTFDGTEDPATYTSTVTFTLQNP